MSRVDELIQELSLGLSELKCQTGRAQLYASYIETDLSNFEIIKLKYAFKKKRGSSKNGSSSGSGRSIKSQTSFKKQDSKNRDLRKSTDNL
jgi:hypothetical protein